MAEPSLPASPLRCVVQVGFAGARKLFEGQSTEDAARWQDELGTALREELARLPERLGLGSGQFLCGISQVAVGADFLFAAACRDLGIPQRIFLPRSADDYLSDVGSSGPDFSESEQEAARAILADPNVIQERVVSGANDRTRRFEDANLEILRVSDAIICLLREDAVGKTGGTNDMLVRALKRRKPTLEMRFTPRDGQLSVRTEIHNAEEIRGDRAPSLPREIYGDSHVPPKAPDEVLDAAAGLTTLKSRASTLAKKHQRFFRRAAAMVVSTHVGATVLATIALASHARRELMATLLGAELFLLLAGFLVHRALHRSHTARTWALARLVAEVLRSAQRLAGCHVYLEHLFHLPIPRRLRPLLRTVNVLHLVHSRHATANAPADGWAELRTKYARDELAGDQIPYYEKQSRAAKRGMRATNVLFRFTTAAAILMTLAKLTVTLLDAHSLAWVPNALGGLAIILPVIAVGALSWSAAMDYEARASSFQEMHRFLLGQRELLDQAESRPEFEKLLLETETRLLGENANWFQRRWYAGIA